MASNCNQPNAVAAAEIPQPDVVATAADADTDLESGAVEQQSEARRQTPFENDSHLATFGRKILNDARLIHGRRINSNQKARIGLELMCEEKVSKYKLEEVHCSLPSSIKSTFIMTFSPDGQRVASTHGDHRIYICDLNTGKLLDTLEGHPKTPWCLAWHRSNREILASGCLAGEVRVWDLRSKACESWTSQNNTIITSLDFHPKERVLVIATANDIHFWDWSESEPFAKTSTNHDKEKVKFVEFDSSGTKLITGISNLPKYAGYSSDSLQNRIIDSYLTQGNLDQLPTENMTQNSEITSPISGSLNSNETATQLSSIRQLIPSTNTNEQDINYRSTLTLSRVASLYRQLEALEDSMRHTSFSPYPRLISHSPNSQSSDVNEHNDGEIPPTQQAPSQGTPLPTVRAPNAFEPLIVSFDESLEHLQLLPIVVDGQAVNSASIIEQYPIDVPYQLHYMMQFESINQVNQNFIRISKLMSSVRLYRLIVQQILSSNSGQGHYLPNQILTAQSVSPRSSRQPSNLPIVFRNFPTEPNNLSGGTRSTDPILAIQFRNSARNVPLATLCKIDLLSARSVCITRSQQLTEQAILGSRSITNDSSSNTRESTSEDSLFYPLLNQLHQSLAVINHAPLTTSNVYAHISSLRGLLNKLLTTMSSMFHTPEEGPRLTGLIHDIAHSLTGRSWNIPLGANLDDIRLDVIHTLCIVDLTLHLTRQVQLLQMQRLSLSARIEESRRTASRTVAQTPRSGPSNIDQTSMPSTSRETSSDASTIKRKDSLPPSDDSPKRRKLDFRQEITDVEMIETRPGQTDSSPEATASTSSAQPTSQSQNTLSEPADRLVVWNNAQTQAVEQSLQRFLVATASNMSNSHILVRIYHRLHGSPVLPSNNALDQPTERLNHPHESRRRALSQDNSAAQQEASSPNVADHGRARQVPGLNSGMNYEAPWQRHPHLHVYQTRGTGQHLWFNQWTIPLPISNSNYRLQCWNFSLSDIPNIKDSQVNILTRKCRIHNHASIDISSDGCLIACLVPRDDSACLPSFDLKIFSLKLYDFGVCYYRLPHGPNAISVSLSPSGLYAVVGLASNKFISSDPSDDDLTIAKVFKLHGKHSFGYVRDIKIKRDDSSLSLNAIRWMSRGIVYNVGPQHHQRYQATRVRNRFA